MSDDLFFGWIGAVGVFGVFGLAIAAWRTVRWGWGWWRRVLDEDLVHRAADEARHHMHLYGSAVATASVEPQPAPDVQPVASGAGHLPLSAAVPRDHLSPRTRHASGGQGQTPVDVAVNPDTTASTGLKGAA